MGRPKGSKNKLPAKRRPLDERFWEKVDKSQLSPGGCWEWTGAKTWRGYGAFVIEKGKQEPASRVSFVLENNIDISKLHICHKCDNPSCVNPAHLFAGTNADNMRDKVKKKRHSFGEKNGDARLTEAQVLEIRHLYSSGNFSQRELAKQFGVSQRAILCIVNRILWKHI
jgi:DNA-binding XRE family transcriptional regulator